MSHRTKSFHLPGGHTGQWTPVRMSFAEAIYGINAMQDSLVGVHQGNNDTFPSSSLWNLINSGIKRLSRVMVLNNKLLVMLPVLI